MISTLLDRLFQRNNVPSGAQVKHRLKFILAHDRAAIEPKVFENMRHEIMRVVSKYVELDESSLDIRLESDKRMTALIANLPIRMVREEMPDLDELFDMSNDGQNAQKNAKSTDAEPSSASSLEMDQFVEAALDAIAVSEMAKSAPQTSISANIAENADKITERTTEITTKLRIAATKSQNAEIGDVETAKTAQVAITDISDDSISITPDEELNEQPSDQLELSLGLPHASESQEVVIEESSEFYNQVTDNQVKE